jgi:hypothetical protein
VDGDSYHDTKLVAPAALFILGAGFTPAAQATLRTRGIPEIGYCVSGSILDYWEQRNIGAAPSPWLSWMVRHPATVGRRSCPHGQLSFERPLDALYVSVTYYYHLVDTTSGENNVARTIKAT